MRFAILGCGSIGRRHGQNLIKLGERDLVLYDRSQAAAAALASELGVSFSRTLEELWSGGPQTAFVTAPTSSHVELALEAATRGCHLFIEKPLSHSREGIATLSAEVGRRGLLAMVGCNMRFHPGPARIKALLEKGALGRVLAARIQTGSYLPKWRVGMDYRESYSASIEGGGGAVLDCIHEIDLALWYFGPGRVVGAAIQPASSIGLAVDGLAEILLLHDSGALSSLHLNFVQRDYRRMCQVIGSEATLYWDFQDRIIRTHSEPESSPVLDKLPDGWDTNNMYIDELRYFLGCLREGRQAFSGLYEGDAALEVALSAKAIASAAPMEAVTSGSQWPGGSR